MPSRSGHVIMRHGVSLIALLMHHQIVVMQAIVSVAITDLYIGFMGRRILYDEITKVRLLDLVGATLRCHFHILEWCQFTIEFTPWAQRQVQHTALGM